jgi:predicted dehydrogenase
MRFRVGVIGATGYIGQPYRREIRECPERANIVALCARRQELLDAAKLEDDADLATQNWREVVEHSDVNLVIVATPDALHYEQVLACAAAGKHIVCEKPVAMNALEARQMWTAVQESGVAHFVPFWTRYVPLFARARQIYQEGTLGEIRAIVYRWHNPRPLSMPFTWRDDATLSAAGSIADVGSHAYDTMRWILGQDAKQVLAHTGIITPAKPDLGDINLDEALNWDGSTSKQKDATAVDYANIAIRWNSGAVGTLTLSHAPFIRKGLAPEIELHGTDASLGVDRVNQQLILAPHEDAPRITETFDDLGNTNRFENFVFPALLAQLAGDTFEFPGMQDGLANQQFTDAAARSGINGGWENCE